MVRKRKPALAAMAQTAVALAALNGTDLKNLKSISGSGAARLVAEQYGQREQ